MGLLIRYLNDEYRYEYELINLCHIESGTAEAIYNKFREFFTDSMIKNLVGLATDGANVMLGKNNSFTQKVKVLKPGIFSVHCLSHIGNLIAYKAHKSIPKSVSVLLARAYSYFSRSPIRNESFLKFQQSPKPKSLLAPNPTRWTRLKMSIDRILLLWDVLLAYFENEIIALKPKPVAVNNQQELESQAQIDDPVVEEEEILVDDDLDEDDERQDKYIIEPKDNNFYCANDNINDKYYTERKPLRKLQLMYDIMTKQETKNYLLFLQTNLDIIVKSIEEFENNTVRLTNIRKKMFLFAKHFYYHIMNDRYLKLSEEENITNYFNAPQKNELLNPFDKFEEDFIIAYSDKINLSNLDQQDKKTFLTNIQNYFKNAMLAVEKYFDFKSYRLFEILDISNRSSMSTLQWIEAYTKFKDSIGDFPFSQIQMEIKDFKSLKDQEIEGSNNLEQWAKINSLQCLENKRFPAISRTAQTLLSLPFSTAQIERVFSSLKLTKTPLRNRLGDQVLNSIMTVKESLKRKNVVLDELSKADLKRIKILTTTIPEEGNNSGEIIHVNLNS